MQKIKEFKAYDKQQILNEIYQKSGMRFALMSAPKDGNLQSCPWIKCRDYLHDAFRAFIHKSSCKIYGFSYDYATDPPIDTRRIRLLVKNEVKNAKDLTKDVIYGVKLINHYESIAGIKLRTKKYEINPGIWVVNGPNFWFKSPVLTSMFTFLLRLGEYRINFENNDDLELALKKHANPEGDNDARYLKSTWDKMAIIIRHYDEIFLDGKRYERCITQKKNKIPINNYHNYMGIVSFCEDRYKYAPSLRNFKKILNKYKKDPKEEPKESKIKAVDNSPKVEEPVKAEKPVKLAEKVEKAKPKAKKLLRIKTQYGKPVYDNYDASSFSAATISSAKNGRTQCFSFTGCREHMIASIRAALSENCAQPITFAFRNNNNTKIDIDKMRLICTVNGVDSGKGKINKTWSELFFAKRVLNAYEHAYGMEKSIISTVKLKHKEGLSTAWLFTGSGDWMSNPVMFSIYVLIIRAAKNAAATIGPLEVISVVKLEKYWKKFDKYIDNAGNKNVYLYKHHKSILDIISQRKNLFTKSPVEAYFANNGDQDIDFYKKVGVISLLDKKHMDKKLVAKAVKLDIIK